MGTDTAESRNLTQPSADEVGLGIILIYLLLDESASMSGSRVEKINAALPEIHKLLREHPAVSDRAHLGVITFSDDATILLDPSDAGTLTSLPGVQAHGNTNYGRAFAQVRSCIERDVSALKADGHQVYRPVVIFMSDGQPNVEGWQDELARLTDRDWKFHPNIVAFGVDEADPDTIRKVGNAGAFIQANYTSAADALGSMFEALIASIISSVNSTGGYQAPTHVTGFDSLI